MTYEILELTEKDCIKGEIYKISNLITKKFYVGQTLSHYKNKKKYRPFGYISRFNSHISEANNNTKKNQCKFLNNSIRKYGESQFIVELIETCCVKDLDEREQYHIEKCDSLYPIGYNLTKGGKTTEHIKVKNNQPLNEIKKRGREFGYVHKSETKEKMSERLKIIASTEIVKQRMKNTMSTFYDNKKIEILQQYEFPESYEECIKPVKNKITGEIHDYIIKIEGRKLTIRSCDESLDEKYNRLKNILIEVKKLKVKIVVMV